MTHPDPLIEELRAVANELILTTPEWWRGAELALKFAVESGTTSIEHSISSEDWRDVVVATDDLMATTRALGLAFETGGTPLKSAVIRIRQRDDDSWHFEVNYEYA